MQTNNYSIITNLFKQVRLSLLVSVNSPRQATALKPILAATVAKIQQQFNYYDRLFSPEKTDLLMTQLSAGDLRPLFKNQNFQKIYSIATRAKLTTNGYFDAFYDGRYQPTNLVKGWIVEQIFAELKLVMGPVIRGGLIEADGIVQTAVTSGVTYQWPVRIEDVLTKRDLLTSYPIQNGSLVSVTAQSLKRPQSSIKQLVITDQQMLKAVIWATAGINAGTGKFLRLIKQHQLSGLLVDRALGVIWFNHGQLRSQQAS